MPIVKVEVSVNWRGSIGKTPLGIATTSTRKAVKIAFETKRRATRWMLRRIWRPSPTIGGTSPNSPETSTRSDTERAIWVPLPWAIASRASFSAGTSLTPSPSMPTYSPPSLSTRTTRALSSGEIRPIAGAARTAASSSASSSGRCAAVERRAARLDPEVAGDRPDRRRVVAGEHLQGDVLAGEEGDRLAPPTARSSSARTTTPSGCSGSVSSTSGPASGSGAP